MIKVEFYNGINGLCGFEITGHADSADYGEDIVCSAVSSTAIMTANTITEVIGLDADARTEDGYLRFMLLEDATRAQDIFRGLQLHLTNIEKQYPENIKVIYRRCNNA